MDDYRQRFVRAFERLADAAERLADHFAPGPVKPMPHVEEFDETQLDRAFEDLRPKGTSWKERFGL